MTTTALRAATTANATSRTAAPGMVQRACACGKSAGPGGQCGGCETKEKLRPASLQPKLSISTPGDPFEREADAIADRVMGMAGPAATPMRVTPLVQREPAGTVSPAPQPSFEGALARQAGGSPLPGDARHFFESRMGRDLDHVRVHDDASAGQLARDIDARAFTLGPDIYFARGEYDPSSRTGRHLLAHELAHVAQQGRAADRIHRAPTPPKPAKALGVEIAKIAQLVLFMCRDAAGTDIINRIESDGVNIVLFETAFDKWKYDDGREEENELTGLQGNTVVGTKTIRLRRSMSARQMGITLFHEMQHWIHNQDPAGPRGLESEIQARIATEQLAIDRGLPETGKGYRKADGRVDEAFIRKEINGSPHYNPTGRKRIGRRYVGETPIPGPWRCPPVGDFPDPGNVRNIA